MSDFLLELLSEEIPARMQAKARADLARLFEAEIAKSGLKAEAIETFSTPRRLTLIARGLPLGTPAQAEELKGPRTAAPPQALEGFLRKTGLSQDQLTDRDGIWFAIIEKSGRATTEVLAEAIPAIVRVFPWPKSMRWGAASLSTESMRWVRPLQGIVAMLDEEVVDFEIGDVRSGAATIGHRFHHPGPITLAGAKDYIEKLRACHVIVDQDERARLIRHGAAAAASAAGLEMVADEGLVEENAGLTEWPQPLLGRFDPAFLEVPREVIQLTMRTNQKYFAATGADGALAPAFICVANIAAADGGAKIVEGNQKVLAARLSDARFFWEQDLKVPLAEQAQKLSQIVFHEKLGTVADKVKRVAELARWLVEEGIVPGPVGFRANQYRNGRARLDSGYGAANRSFDPAEVDAELSELEMHEETERAWLAKLAGDAARLCKADLVTQMVGEFPELQGLIGGSLAAAQGDDPAVAEAIRDHYKPVGQGDDVPTAPVTVAVSLADKLDSIVSFFAASQAPTGSKDPYALRRSALAVIQLVIGNDVRIGLRELFSKTLWVYLRLWDQHYRSVLLMTDVIEAYQGDGDGIVTHRNVHLYEHVRNPDQLDDFLLRDDYRFLVLVDADLKGFDGFIDPEEMQRLSWVRWQSVERTTDQLLDFFADRLKVQQREAGVRHDLIDAVFALGGEDDLVRLLARVRALQAFIETAEGKDLLAGYKRAANILKKEEWIADASANPIRLSYTPENAETALIAALDSAEPEAAAAVEREDFEGAMRALAMLRGPVDAFFNEVIVNDPDPAKREARLNLLARIRGAVHRVADFSRIEG